jgi:hypothetical protein
MDFFFFVYSVSGPLFSVTEYFYKKSLQLVGLRSRTGRRKFLYTRQINITTAENIRKTTFWSHPPLSNAADAKRAIAKQPTGG